MHLQHLLVFHVVTPPLSLVAKEVEHPHSVQVDEVARFVIKRLALILLKGLPLILLN